MARFPTARRRARPAGFSLVELLIAMTLGLVVLGGLVAVFAGNRRASDLNVAMADMQESVRFAMSVIAGDLRMAGHQGCLDFNGASVSVVADDAPTADYRRTAVGGAVVQSASVWSPAFALGTAPNAFAPPSAPPAVPGTHALAVQFGGPEVLELRAGMRDGAGNPDASVALPLAGPLDVAVGDPVLVSTCEDGEIFTVTDVAADVDGNVSLGHDATRNASGSFLEAYGTGTTASQVRVMPFSTNVYYVGDTGLRNAEGRPIRALYQQSAPFDAAANPPVELVRGVENMRLGFGIGTAGAGLRHVGSDSADYDPTRIRSVRIGLLMASDEPIASAVDTRDYVLAGQTIASSATSTDGTDHRADRRFRLAFNTTVKVRNRRAAE